MELEHSFTVPASVDDVWQALLDPERVAPCMPGAALTGVEGQTFKGKVKVKLGPVAMQYKGTGEYIETDEATHTVVIKASGKDAKGNGTAAATVTLKLTGDGQRTTGASTTDLTVTGKPAQFGRGMIAEVGGKILEQFAANLGDSLAGSEEPGAAAGGAVDEGAAGAADGGTPGGVGASSGETAASGGGGAGGAAAPLSTADGARPTVRPTAPPPREAEALDLSEFARGAVLKRALPLIGVGAVAALIAIIVLRCRGSDDD
ncbi:SRPBCC family protein [Tomitella fengzijianii]|uniref:Carbon monoxide dehydrogenase n=1 Tax=Tomitella fengzijianii TaxID=2597660 RepID=A0A516X3C9_9ACTN|nr:SRPBCC family protein [Tomitella fengzijianii]QDQ97582.1 carbon monoxide dehydrogenase [Tomitella fengzijianii]